MLNRPLITDYSYSEVYPYDTWLASNPLQRVSAVKRLTDSGTDVRHFGRRSGNGLQKTLALSQFPCAACPAKRAEICRSVYY